MPVQSGLTADERQELLANMDRLLALYVALEAALKRADLGVVAELKVEAESLRARNAEIRAWITRGSA